jgi:hypothetical protein
VSAPPRSAAASARRRPGSNQSIDGERGPCAGSRPPEAASAWVARPTKN